MRPVNGARIVVCFRLNALVAICACASLTAALAFASAAFSAASPVSAASFSVWVMPRSSVVVRRFH